MGQRILNLRAAIFDIYSTVLEVGTPPHDADALWSDLFEEMLGGRPGLSRTEFSVRSAQIIARQHTEARVRGIQYPEIQWPTIIVEAIPELRELAPEQLDEFIFRQMQISRTLRLADHAVECLHQFVAHKFVMGIASNAQAYTLRELSLALQGSSIGLNAFDPDLRFWSFQNGFSKPDPHVFRALTSRLEARGISPSETLMVGDRLDNDIVPARSFGWQTWQLAASGAIGKAGNWRDLQAWLLG